MAFNLVPFLLVPVRPLLTAVAATTTTAPTLAKPICMGLCKISSLTLLQRILLLLLHRLWALKTIPSSTPWSACPLWMPTKNLACWAQSSGLIGILSQLCWRLVLLGLFLLSWFLLCWACFTSVGVAVIMKRQHIHCNTLKMCSFTLYIYIIIFNYIII